MMSISLIERELASERRLPYEDMTGAALQSEVMDEASRKSQAKWNMSSGTGSLRIVSGLSVNSRVSDAEDGRWRSPLGMPERE